MPDLSLSQALGELSALKNRIGTPPTLAELRDIVARTRVTQVDAVNKSLGLRWITVTRAIGLRWDYGDTCNNL
jgi:hypothetical protein